MSTIGHPLSDLVNLLMPYKTATSNAAVEIGHADPKFLPGGLPGLPTKEQCIAWYRELAGWDPSPEMLWGDAFGIYRGSIIMQGIAARYAQRQASSPKAKEYGALMHPWAEIAWELVERTKSGKSKL